MVRHETGISEVDRLSPLDFIRQLFWDLPEDEYIPYYDDYTHWRQGQEIQPQHFNLPPLNSIPFERYQYPDQWLPGDSSLNDSIGWFDDYWSHYDDYTTESY